MKRRVLLGTLASLAVAGCTGSDPGATVTETTRTTTPPKTSADPTTPTTSTANSGTPPEIRDLGVPVGDADCPFDSDAVERVVCYPEQTDAVLSLTPDHDELALPADSTTFTLANDTDAEFRANFYDWSLHKRVDGEWFFVTPRVVPEPLHVLPGGASHDWSFAVDNGEEPAASSSSESSVELAGLGGGEYAFTISGWFESGDHDHRVGLGARFGLDGDRLELEPTEDASASRDGDTVTVTRKSGGTTAAVFVVERVGEAGVPPERPIRDRIAEQVVRPTPTTGDPNPLRNTLPFFEGDVTTVRLEMQAEIEPPYGTQEPYYLGYRDDVYEVAVRKPE